MAGPIEVQLRNAQSSILFMQQEHAQTLQGLHSELQKLQKKCAELTFELAMKSDDADEEQSRDQHQELERKVEKAEEDARELEEHLAEKERKIFSLEQQLKVQEKKLQTEMKQNKKKLLTLSNELEQKSANIAYLTNQLHQMALVRHKPRDMSPEERVHVNSPQPPQTRPPPSHRRRVRTPSIDSVSVLKSGKISADTFEAGSKMDVPVSHTKRLSSPGNSRSLDDRELAAYVAKVDTATSDIEIKPAPPILPPISPFPQENRAVHQGSGYSPTHSPYYTRRPLRVSKRRDTEQAEVNSLAVEVVHTTKKDFHAAQHSKGESS